MKNYKFWESWDTDIRYPYLFLMGLATVALLLGAFHYVTGDSYAFAWDKLPSLDVVQVPVQEITRLLEPLTLYADSYLVSEQYDVAPPAVNTVAAMLFLGGLAICIAFYTAAISTMKQLPYFAGMLLLMLLLASFTLDDLDIFGQSFGQTTLLVCIALLAVTSYIFHSFYPDTRFSIRILTLLLVITFIGALIFSEANTSPVLIALHLVNYSSLATLVATLLFMIWVSYENVNALLWVNTQASKPERRFSIWQFVLVSLLYLLNLLLLYLRHVGYIKADLFYVNAYFLFLLSTVAGFWGMRQREAFYGKLFRFKPTGAILYLVFATISFLSIGYAFATSNDSLKVLYHDLIVYTHLAFGVMFFIYVMLNFGKLLEDRLQVYKVVYEPRRLPLYTLYTMGSIILAILVMRTQYRTYFYAYAGYYNYLGDLYLASENPVLAESFYKQSDLYDLNNVKANYSLAGIYRASLQPNKEILRLKDAISKRPNPKLYVRLANLYEGKKFFFEKQYVLLQGAEAFPNSGELYNNLAMLYANTSVTDSVEYYFRLAQEYSSDNDFIRSNRLAFYTNQAMPDKLKEVLEESRSGKYKPLQSNLATVRLLLGQPADGKMAPAPDSLGQVEDFTLFYNNAISSLATADTSSIRHIDKYLANPANQLFQEDLLFLKGMVHHAAGRPVEARRILENLAGTSDTRSGYYYHVLGIWLMEERNYRTAAGYFKLAKDHGASAQAFLAHGYALTLAYQSPDALEALDEVAFTEQEEPVEVARALRTLLEQPVDSVIANASDNDKVQYLLAYLPSFTVEEVDALVKSVQEKELRRVALVTRIDYFLLNRRWRLAHDAIKEAGSVLRPEDELRSKLNMQQMKLWLYTKNHDALLNRMNNLYLNPRDKRQKLYFSAKIADVRGRQQEAEQKYKQAVTMLLYDEEVVEAAADFFARTYPTELEAYNILLDGVTYNPNSARLYKAYALESLKQGLSSYANQALITLQRLLPAAEYSIFREEFEKKQAAQDAAAESWPT
ncbi:hypothetical protein FVR03_15085 [Pontibacter qinzhouensis]|uniref:Tetratricopeptide repeat protein n=1 Tax=Pontibacter qinzhouensis TaxID=2603253 RepID=A0A5C8JJD2_9BACT|nr:hypothetical protein [Pontibacter qinzhouensis]TXK37562.1 hypothetical protein FVR03_15085 [Pontibacter qinzhouensis]